MTTVGDLFPADEFPRGEPLIDRRSRSKAEMLRDNGWVQAYYPGAHAVREARVWTHPGQAIEPVTFATALCLAGYPSRRRWR